MSTAHEVRDAVAALVEAVTGLTEWTGDTGAGPVPGWFSVVPAGLSGLGRNRRGVGDQVLGLVVSVRFMVIPDAPARIGELLDVTQRIETGLLTDVDGSVSARLSLGDAVYDYATPGYALLTIPITADGLLTAPT